MTPGRSGDEAAGARAALLQEVDADQDLELGAVGEQRRQLFVLVQ
jgi:hypothetical protein